MKRFLLLMSLALVLVPASAQKKSKKFVHETVAVPQVERPVHQ